MDGSNKSNVPVQGSQFTDNVIESGKDLQKPNTNSVIGDGQDKVEEFDRALLEDFVGCEPLAIYGNDVTYNIGIRHPSIRNLDVTEYLNSPDSTAAHERHDTYPAEHDLKPFVCQQLEDCICNDASLANSRLLYKRLPSDDHIRLLEILPASIDSKSIKCHMHIASLLDCSQRYEALSYTWKIDSSRRDWQNDIDTATSESSPPEIELNGVNVKIGENLFDALNRLRDPVHPKIIWADALCINQSDTNERSLQVSKMDMIFSNAHQVIVWLGKCSKDESIPQTPVHLSEPYRAFSGVCKLVNAWRFKAGLCSTIPFATHSKHIDTPEGETTPRLTKLSLSDQVLMIFNQRWFSRLWVFQEIVLARKATFIWGDCEISWQILGLAAALIRTNYNRIFQFYGNLVPWNPPAGVANAYLMYRLSKGQQHSKAVQLTFLELLRLTKHFECQDNRDHVYGLLGLPTVDGVAKRLVPDYTKSYAEVNFEVAQMILETSGSAALLSCCQRKGSKEISYLKNRASDFDESLPSWVPQWQFFHAQTLAPFEEHSDFAASKHSSTQLKFSDNGRKLILQGILTDKVSGIHGNSRLSWRRTDKRAVAKLLYRSRYTESDLENLALTLTGGKNWYGLPVEDISDHVGGYIQGLFSFGLAWSLEKNAFGQKPDEAIPTNDFDGDCEEKRENEIIDELIKLSSKGEPFRYTDAVKKFGEGRTTFVTEKGETGLGPMTMAQGDLVFVLYGLDVPLILRPSGDSYVVVGECYIRNLMHGEAIQKLSEPGSGLEESWIELI